MLVPAITGAIILLATVAYVIFRKFSITRQAIEFAAPQNGVAVIYLDIREDTVRSLHILYEDGTLSEVRRLGTA